MKKIALFICMACVALGMSAQTITSTSLITLKSAGVADKEVGLLLSADFSNDWDNTWDATPAQAGGIYVYYQDAPYSIWASNEYSQNLALAFDANDNETYRLSFSSFTGQEYTITDLDNNNYVITVNANTQDYVFTIDESEKNSSILDRFVINYVPAPTCDYSREGLTVGKYYTICLPKAVENPTGASFWNLRYRNSEGTLAYLEEATGALVAGRPYIFQAEATELCFEYNSGDDVPAGAYGALVGTITGMEQDALTAAGANIYLLKNNELWFVSGQSGNVLPEKRAYVNYDNFVEGTPNAAPGRRVRAIPMQTNGTTGFENLNVSEAPAKMIIDGKMYILRGEQMFDATGRLVK